MTLFRIVKEIVTTKWAKANCSVCGQLYDYPEGGYKPSTCSKYECLHKYLHPELNKERG